MITTLAPAPPRGDEADALPPPPPRPPARRRPRRQRPARADRRRLPDRLDDHAAQPARPRRDLRLAARRRHPRGLPPQPHRTAPRTSRTSTTAKAGTPSSPAASRSTTPIEARRALRAPRRAAASDSAATSRSASPASPTARSPRSPAGARTPTSTSTCARPAPGSASKSCERRGPKRAADPLHE